MFGVRPTATSRWDPSIAPASVCTRTPSPSPSTRSTRDVGADRHPLGDEEAGDLGGDVVVLAPGDVLPAFEDRHGAAEAAEHLAELEGDVAPAEDDEVLGQGVEVEDAVVVEPGHVGEAGDRRFGCPGADVEEHLRRDQ